MYYQLSAFLAEKIVLNLWIFGAGLTLLFYFGMCIGVQVARLEAIERDVLSRTE